MKSADFYGTWCVGCAKVYPEVCRVASDQALRQKCHFVKVWAYVALIPNALAPSTFVEDQTLSGE